MKQLKISILALFCALLVCSPVFAKKQSREKMYIPKNAIQLSDTGITLIVDDARIPLAALYSDENGFYIYDTQLKAKWPDSYCDDHGRYQAFNDWFFDGCPRCPAPDGDAAGDRDTKERGR